MLLYQPQEGYCYNSDSIFLYDFISSFAPRGRMLDVGAGCGVVGLLVARDNPKVRLEAVEKQDVFVQYASKNAEVNGIDYRVHHTDFLAFKDPEGFDYIVSNPPFYHEGASRSENEMVHTARYNLHLPIDAFISHAAKLLRPQGHLLLCYDPQQFAHLCAACERAKLRVVDVQFVHSKPDRNATLVMLHARKNSRSLMRVRPPIFAFDEDEFSAKSLQVYRDARTHSIKCTP
ncbi:MULTISPECIES: tRNA1(Val) (adenine(37)-N6)-methyltransferase [Sulfurimonas]|uniref:Methyltransferase n=1 Tax=Sulfurimonas diazotrophicus TaxID=3131939 RepID=A0ABZ3HAA8_9BACT